MNTLLLLALRNLRRNRARTALTFGAVFVGVMIMVVLAGFDEGQDILVRSDVINARLGAIQVHRKGYSELRDNQPIDLNMPAHGEVLAVLMRHPEVRAVAPRLLFGGSVNNGRDSTVFVGKGLDPVHEYEVLPWSRDAISGAPLAASHPTGALVGKDLAVSLGLGAKSSTTVQASTLGGQQNALDIDLVGTVEGNALESKRLVLMPLQHVQELLRMPGLVNEFVVAVRDVHRIDAVAADLRRSLGPAYEVVTWEELDPALADCLNLQAAIIAAIGMICLAIVSFGVINTMRMNVMERTREIGTMMALGMRCVTVSAMFVQEATLLATAATAAGVAAAYGAQAAIVMSGGILVAGPGATQPRFCLLPQVPLHMVMLVAGCAIAGAALAAAYPAWRAARLDPVVALRAT